MIRIFLIAIVIFITITATAYIYLLKQDPTLNNISNLGSLLSPLKNPKTKGDIQKGAQSPDFRMVYLSGDQKALSDFKGKKPVVLTFWTTWCPRCRKEYPLLESLYLRYKNDIEFININVDEDPKTVKSYVTKNNYLLPVVLDIDSSIRHRYAVVYTKTHVYINKQGVITNYEVDDIDETKLKDLL